MQAFLEPVVQFTVYWRCHKNKRWWKKVFQIHTIFTYFIFSLFYKQHWLNPFLPIRSKSYRKHCCNTCFSRFHIVNCKFQWKQNLLETHIFLTGRTRMAFTNYDPRWVNWNFIKAICFNGSSFCQYYSRTHYCT